MKINLTQIILILSLLGGVFLMWLSFDKYLRIRAVEGCMTASTFKFEDKEKGTTTIEPMKDAYAHCMKEKGYETE